MNDDRTRRQIEQRAAYAATQALVPKLPRKLHPADIADHEKIRRATRFRVHFRKGPVETYRAEASTLDEARAIAASLDAAHGVHGRSAMIYAVDERGASIPLPIGWEG
jgi:hypothetical protein